MVNYLNPILDGAGEGGKKAVVLRRPGVTIFDEIIKILTIVLKKSLKIQEKLKELGIMHQNAIYTCIF